MNIKRIFGQALMLMTIMSGVASLLVPKGLSPNIIEDLESNYQNIKSLYKKSVQLKDLLPEENFSLISRFLDDLKNYVNDYRSQENRSGVLLQKISIKFKHMQSGLDEAVLNEKLLKDQAEDLRKFVQELEAKIDGIKADPMMFTQGKANELFRMIQDVKEKSFPAADPIEDFYTAQETKEAKKRQIDQLDRQKRELEAQVEREKYDKNSKAYSLEMAENEIRDSSKKLGEAKKQNEEAEKPKPQTSLSDFENASNKVFHYIFIADTSIREENQNVFEQIDSNIEAIKIARESEADVFSIITFEREARFIAKRLPIFSNAMRALKDIKPVSKKSNVEKGLEKAREIWKESKGREETTIVILYMDGMKWYYDAAEPAIKAEKGYKCFGKIWNSIVDMVNRFLRRQQFLRPIKEDDIAAIKEELGRFSDPNLIGFVSGTTMQNQEILKGFAKALNRNETVLQTTIGEKYEYFNLASATEIFPKILKTLSFAEKGLASQEYRLEQARKTRQRETEDLRKEERDFFKNKLVKEEKDLQKIVNESLRKKTRIEDEIKSLMIKIEVLQSEISSIESKMTGLTEEIRLINQKSSERERAIEEREKLEVKNADIKIHLQTLEQLVKTVQARDHNILAIFEHVTVYCKDFLIHLERVLIGDGALGFDALVKFYRDDLGLDGTTDLESIEKICQLWFGHQEMTKDFFKLINPRDLIDNDLEIRKVELNDLKDEYQEFYRNLRRKIFVFKTEQKNSLKKEINSLFSQDVEKLLEKLNERIYMMY